MNSPWAQLEPSALDEFLLWAIDQGASDVSFQTGSPAYVEIDGALRRATAGPLDGLVMTRLVERIFNATGDGILRSGRAIDCSYAVLRTRSIVHRLRCNLAPVLVANGFGVNITLRVLRDTPPSFEELGIEDDIRHAWMLCRGLTLVTGIPGSGKSTLLAAGTRRLLETGAGRIQSYEAPIEFTFDCVKGDASLISSSEIPRHFTSFADGVRSSLRRRPAAIVVGEARDLETVDAVIRAADFGIAAYATAHTIGVAPTIRRLLAEFPAAEREERGAALIDVLNLVVTQMLLPAERGGRIAIREWLFFETGLKADLMELPPSRWPARIAAALDETGNHLPAAARKAWSSGEIAETDLLRIEATRRQS